MNLIGNTTTRAGLKVRAALDTNSYPTGIEVSDEELAAVKIKRAKFHGDWNYTHHCQESEALVQVNHLQFRWARKLRLTVGKEEGRNGVLEGWPGRELRLERYERGPTEGGHWTMRATAKLASGEELELRFDCGPERESANAQPSDLVYLLAARDIPGRVLLRDGTGERDVATYPATLGNVRFTKLEQPRFAGEHSDSQPQAEEEGMEAWSCESAGFESVENPVFGWAVLGVTIVLLATVFGWRIWRRRQAEPGPGGTR